VLAILASGETWKATAARLEISPETVHFHTRNLRRKICAPNCLAALARALC
jgi:DNA-binding CsgD family transcriptional regulator